MNRDGIAVRAINNSLHCHVMNATSTLKRFPAQSSKLRRNKLNIRAFVTNERFQRMSLSQILVDIFLETNTVIAKNCNSFSECEFETVLVNPNLCLSNIWKSES